MSRFLLRCSVKGGKMAKNTYTPVLKYGTTNDWSKAKNFTPELGTIIVYTDTEPPKIKYGDGQKNVSDLPFVGYTNYEVEDGMLSIN